MKCIYLLAILCIVSCSSVKQSTSALQSGNYDDAILTSLEKIRKSPSQKKLDSHILLLETAFEKAVQRDTDRISFLKKQGSNTTLKELYNTYVDLKKRQQLIQPVLPLTIASRNREATFKFANYDDNIISYKNQLVDYIYTTAVSELSQAQYKQDYRTIYKDLNKLNKLQPNYKDVASLLEEAHYKGTDFIEVALYNDSNIALPKRLEQDLLDFDTYGINDFWKVYHSTAQDDVAYDYVMDVSLREINISPERVQERQLVKEKSIPDGTTFLKDKKGNFVLDEDGKKTEVDRFIDVSCDYYEVLQSKAVNIVGQVRYNNKQSGQLVKTFPLASEFIFEHYYATYDGDKRALDKVQLGYTRNRVVPFPTNEQMVYDVGEDLKLRLKNIILNSNL